MVYAGRSPRINYNPLFPRITHEPPLSVLEIRHLTIYDNPPRCFAAQNRHPAGRARREDRKKLLSSFSTTWTKSAAVDSFTVAAR